MRYLADLVGEYGTAGWLPLALPVIELPLRFVQIIRQRIEHVCFVPEGRNTPSM
jgi:hypothetical protein